MDTTEQIAQEFERMGYTIDFMDNRIIEVVKLDFSYWTNDELDELFEVAGMYDSVRVIQLRHDPRVAQVETGV
tara:strand:- start:98 stop:316 length:219 start_codon:yes stop_codon:yes gene_type:complete